MNFIKKILVQQELATIQTKLLINQEITFAVDCLVQDLPSERIIVVLNSALVLVDSLKKTNGYVFRPNCFDYPELELMYHHKLNRIIINK